jgi:hypothetical protein
MPVAAAVAMLKASPDIVAACGDRVFPIVAPQGAALPLIIVKHMATESDYDLAGKADFTHWLLFDVRSATGAAGAMVSERIFEALGAWSETAWGEELLLSDYIPRVSQCRHVVSTYVRLDGETTAGPVVRLRALEIATDGLLYRGERRTLAMATNGLLG